MSLGSNIGAEAAAKDILKSLNNLERNPNFEKWSAKDITEYLKLRCQDIIVLSTKGWY